MKKTIAILIAMLLICSSGIVVLAEDDIPAMDSKLGETVQEEGQVSEEDEEELSAEEPVDEFDEIPSEEPADVQVDQSTTEGETETPESETVAAPKSITSENEIKDNGNRGVEGKDSERDDGTDPEEGDDPTEPEVIDSGTCGDNLTWTLTGTETDMVLTISGTGEMDDYTNFESEEAILTDSPWYGQRTSIKHIVIGDEVTSIGAYAFRDCAGVSAVTVPDNVLRIGEGAFTGCTGLKSMTLPFIGESANAEREHAVIGFLFDEISDGVSALQKVGDWAGYITYNCHMPPELEEVTITGGKVSSGAFSQCSMIQRINVPDGMTSIESYAFDGCMGLRSFTIQDSVTSIGKGAFMDCRRIQEFVIPDSVTSIGGDAFHGCYGLRSITLPTGITRIEYGTFTECIKMTDVTIPDGVTIIGDHAFRKCSSLANVVMPNSVTVIDGFAFSECTNLTSITLPANLETIGEYAFDGCNNIKSITIPDGVTSIGDGAFKGFSSVTTITIPDSVTEIGCFAFENCSRLKNITIPNSVTSIGHYAFEGCSSLESIEIPNGVTIIDGGLFSYCSSLTSVSIPDSVTFIDDFAFEYCSSLESIVLPEGVTVIGSHAFAECRNLSQFTIPDGVTVIEQGTFNGCSSLSEITIPEGVKSIKNYAFDNCNNIKYVFYGGSEEQWESYSVDVGNAIVHYNSKGHQWNNELTVDMPSTCIDHGSGSIHCKVCGIMKPDSSQELPFNDNHMWSEWSTISQPTYTSKGIRERYCERCGITEQSEIAVLSRKSISKAVVSGVTTKNYTGKSITQSPTVKIGTKTLKSGTNYTLSYKNNKAIGTATVTITGKGAYTGSVKKTFTIGPKGTTVSKLTKAKKAFTVKWGKQSTQMLVSSSKKARITGYQIQYSTNKSFKSGNKTKTVKGYKNTSSKITGLKAKKVYYVRIRTYIKVGSKTYYSTWSAAKSVKTN